MFFPHAGRIYHHNSLTGISEQDNASQLIRDCRKEAFSSSESATQRVSTFAAPQSTGFALQISISNMSARVDWLRGRQSR